MVFRQHTTWVWGRSTPYSPNASLNVIKSVDSKEEKRSLMMLENHAGVQKKPNPKFHSNSHSRFHNVRYQIQDLVGQGLWFWFVWRMIDTLVECNGLVKISFAIEFWFYLVCQVCTIIMISFGNRDYYSCHIWSHDWFFNGLFGNTNVQRYFQTTPLLFTNSSLLFTNDLIYS